MICSFIIVHHIIDVFLLRNVVQTNDDNSIHLYLIFNRKSESEAYIQFTFIIRHQIFTNLHRKVI